MKELKINSSPDIKIFLLGNKVDLEEQREVTKDQGNLLKSNYDLDLFMETSAKDGEIVESIFVQAAKLLYQDYVKYKIGNPLINKTKVDDNKLKKGKDNTAKKKCC